MKAIILSNCTHAPLREYFGATGIFDGVESMPLYTVRPEDRDSLYERLRSFDVIISLVHGDAWGSLSSASLKSGYGDRCVLFTTPFFNGLHPDMVLINAGGAKKVRSPLSDYHSGLVLWGFLRGMEIDRLEEIYWSGEFPDIFDVRSSWRFAIEELESRDVHSDIPTADIYETVCRSEPGMLTFNHPGMSILSEISRRLLRYLGLESRVPRLSPLSVYNPLASDVSFPVSPAAIRSNNLPYETSPVFRCGLTGVNPGKVFSFREFSEICYVRYRDMNLEDLEVTTPKNVGQNFQKSISYYLQGHKYIG